MLRSSQKSGYTVMEVLVVISILVILGALSIPTIGAFRGNTRIKAAADAVRSRIADARMKAIEGGQAYRLAISSDGRRLQVTPDSADAFDPQSGTFASGQSSVEDELPEEVFAELMMDEESVISEDNNGWRRIATFLPDGTCREDLVQLILQEAGVNPLLVRLRGVTGSTTILTQSANSSGGR